MATYSPENVSPLVYSPSDVSAHAGQRLNIFIPKAPFVRPPGGWPVIINTLLTNFNVTGILSSLSNAASVTNPNYTLLRLLEMGFCVVSASITESVTVAYSGANHGLGLFFPPGHVSGRWEDPTYPMAEKDCQHIVQYLRQNSGDVGGSGVRINPDKISIACVSGGGLVWNHLVFCGSGKAGDFWATGVAATDPQYGQSTRLNTMVMLRHNAMAYELYVDATVNVHFPDASGNDVKAATIGDVPDAILNVVSPFANPDAAFLASGAMPRILFAIDENPSSVNVSHKYTPTYDALETAAHSPYGAFIFKTLYPGLAITVNEGDKAAFSPAPFAAERAKTDYFYVGDLPAADFEAVLLAKAFGTIPAPFPNGPRIPKLAAEFTKGPVNIQSLTTVDANWIQLFPANPARKLGVWLFNGSTSPSIGLTYRVTNGTVGVPGPTAFAILPPLSNFSEEADMFIPGTGPVLVQRSGVTNITAIGVEY